MTTLESRHIATSERLGVQGPERSLGCNDDLDQPSLEGALTRLMAYASLTGATVSLATAQPVFSNRERNRSSIE